MAMPVNALGIGTDLCSVARMTRELASEGHGFRDQVFTPGEIAYCESKRYPAQHYAARFAAKEAVFKALSGPRLDRLPWQDAEVENDVDGRPRIVLRGRLREVAENLGAGRVLVTLSHTREAALAFVVVTAAEQCDQAKEPSDE